MTLPDGKSGVWPVDGAGFLEANQIPDPYSPRLLWPNRKRVSTERRPDSRVGWLTPSGCSGTAGGPNSGEDGSTMSNTTNTIAPEVRDDEGEGNRPSRWAVVTAIAEKIDCSAHTR